ncbi:MAG: hypothetical protein IKS35_00665 [Clostridia bacterium]|nr:hypothetical protein [Clostridia bacterium]
MNAKKIVKTACLIGMVLVLVGALFVPSFAGAVNGRFYETDSYGGGQYSSANFVGNYYSPGSSSNNMILRGECKGGNKSNNYTTLRVRIYNNLTGQYGINEDIQLNSTDENSSYLLAVINHPSADLDGSLGYAIETSHGSDSNWDVVYRHYWLNEEDGWAAN